MMDVGDTATKSAGRGAGPAVELVGVEFSYGYMGNPHPPG